MLDRDHLAEFSLNHVSVPKLSWHDLFSLATSLGCSGVELRNDLSSPLFGGDTAENVGAAALEMGLKVHALAEVPCFNDATADVLKNVARLAEQAKRAGAAAIVLIPRIGGAPATEGTLCHALDLIGNVLAKAELRGLIEPIGFVASSLRDADLARRAIDETHGPARFGLVHDTFHHYLAGSGPVSARHVDIVHVSGVTTNDTGTELTDDDRGFVGADDILGNIEQIAKLRQGGFRGPISMEAFSQTTQSLTNPKDALSASFDFMRSGLMCNAA